MGIIALSYLGVNSNKIEDWSIFATKKLGMQKVDKSSKSVFLEWMIKNRDLVSLERRETVYLI